jgi:hypothetical protein
MRKLIGLRVLLGWVRLGWAESVNAATSAVNINQSASISGLSYITQTIDIEGTRHLFQFKPMPLFLIELRLRLMLIWEYNKNHPNFGSLHSPDFAAPKQLLLDKSQIETLSIYNSDHMLQSQSAA